MNGSIPTRRMVVVIVGVLMLAGCTGVGSDDASGENTPIGPCLDTTTNVIGEPGLAVVYEAQQVPASLDYETFSYCPGTQHDGMGPLEADGFLHDIDQAVVDVPAGALVEVRGAGYPSAVLESDAPVTEMDESGAGSAWLVGMPDTPVEYEIILNLEWSHGKARYAFIARVGSTATGPARLESDDDGLHAFVDDGSESYFHLDGPAQGYADGSGGLVYQSLTQFRWANNVDVVWLPLGSQIPDVIVSAGSDSLQLQGVDGGRILTVGASLDETDGVITTGERRLQLTDIESGMSFVLMTFSNDDRIGIGRASIAGDRIVVSLRSKRCTWFEFVDPMGVPVAVDGNPRPLSDGCSEPLATGAVLLDGNRLAYVETEPDFEYDFDPAASPYVVVPFSQVPRQAVVLVDLATGAQLSRTEIEHGSVVQWLEPFGDGVAASLGVYDEGTREPGDPGLPLLRPAPDISDIGSDLGPDLSGARPSGSLFVDGSGAPPTANVWWWATGVDSVDPRGLCSAALSVPEFGPPTGTTGLGVDVEIETFELNEAAENTRAAIVAAARSCDYATLAGLAYEDRAAPSFFAGGSFHELAASWAALENSGESPLAALVGLLQYAPTAASPYRWDGNRGDVSVTVATVTIDGDGRWIGFQTP